MSMFVFVSEYQRPLEEIDEHRPAHLDWLAGQYAHGRVLISGRRVPPVGGVVILQAEDLEEARSIIAEDPFAKAGVAAYEPYEFTPSASPARSPEVDSFLARAGA